MSPPEAEGTEGERLQKALARAGFGSRRSCEDLIRAGRVRVNGRKAQLGDRVDPLKDDVMVNGLAISLAPDLVYIALHKPAGVVTTSKDTHGRPTVLDLVGRTPRVFPVGRLDRDTSGLLLLTNDGDFANRVAHPRYGVAKTYVAAVRGTVPASAVRKLLRGIELDDGPAAAVAARVQATSRGRSLLEVQVREGRNRLVRRMLAAAGLDISSLVRTGIGAVRLGRLKEGTWRALRHDEVLQLLGDTQRLD